MIKIKRWSVILLVFVFINLAAIPAARFTNGNEFYSRWIPIGGPSAPAVKIVGLEIGSYPGGVGYRGRETSVYVEAAGGGTYKCCGKNQEDSWEQVKEIKANEALFLNLCGPIESDNDFHLAGEKDQMSAQWCGEWESGSVTYSIDSDGAVWERKIFFSSGGAMVTGTVTCLGSLVILIGLFIANSLVSLVTKVTKG